MERSDMTERATSGLRRRGQQAERATGRRDWEDKSPAERQQAYRQPERPGVDKERCLSVQHQSARQSKWQCGIKIERSMKEREDTRYF